MQNVLRVTLTLIMQAPDAKQIPVVLQKHNHRRTDPYFWMNKRDSTDVLDYIARENAYSGAYFEKISALTESLLDEFELRIDPNETGSPFPSNDLTYRWKSIAGKDYRQLFQLTETTEILFFDENERAAGHEYYDLGEWGNSPDNTLLTFSEDTVGRRNYCIRFRLNASNEQLPDELHGTDGSFVWANDNRTLFYVKKDPLTLREFQVLRHELGTPQSDDVLVFQEDDERFYVHLSKSYDRSEIHINILSSTTSEVRLIDASAPKEAQRIFLPRKKGHLYQVDHHGKGYYLLSNHKSPNRKLLFSETIPTTISDCSVVIAHNKNSYLEAFIAFENQLVVQQRSLGKTVFVYGDLSGNRLETVSVPEEVYEMNFSWNDDYHAAHFFYSYTSLTTPASIYRFDLATGKSTLVHRKELRDKSFDPENYESKRVWATANDGTKIPVSLVWKKGIDLAKAPLLLYGYGAYGITIPVNFSPYRVSLLDRGFVYAIAHIRGGKFLGEHWYENGKLQKKRHSFTDFINAAEWLAMQGYCDPGCIFAEGGSAGGLLMGGVANMAPHLFKGIIAQVPFVDVVTTMLDDSLPLTVGEYEEWGNPNDAESYWYMLSYSPYDQVRPASYPAMYITTGYHDSQVQYWEPLKWVARLRDCNQSTAPVLFDCTMSAGHGGGSGRTIQRLETAKEFAFLLNVQGIHQ